MTIEERIVTAVRPLVPQIAPEVYEGKSRIYCTYNYDLIGRDYAVGEPIAYVALVQVHLYLPRGKPSLPLRLKLAQALAALGGTYPDITGASDGTGQHFVFEFELLQDVRDADG